LGVTVDAAALTPRRSGRCSVGGVSPSAAVPAPSRLSAALARVAGDDEKGEVADG
jgi:hypothetical protein